MRQVKLTPGHPATSRKCPCNEEDYKTSQNPQPTTTFLSSLNLAPRDSMLNLSISLEMVFSSLKELSIPPSRKPPYFMSKNFGPGSCMYL